MCERKEWKQMHMIPGYSPFCSFKVSLNLILIFMITPEIDIGENVISRDCVILSFYLLCYFWVLVFTLGLSNNRVF